MSAHTTKRVTVCTIVKGRADHLARLLQGLARSTHLPDEVVIIYMGCIPEVILGEDGLPFPLRIGSVDLINGMLPLAHARNEAAALASNDLLIYLDVDCIPSVDLITHHTKALSIRDQLWMGTVRYLQQPITGEELNDLMLYSLSRYNKIQPKIEEGDRSPTHDYTLFWSLNFSLTVESFNRIGGFDEEFVGYGGEDTDFALSAKRAGVKFGHVGALAFHQYHETQTPPTNHLRSIVRNSNYYHYKHGSFPMKKWLDAFEDKGLIKYKGRRIELTDFGRS